MQNIIRQTSSGALGLPIARANGSEPNIAIAVPIRPAATFSPKANARAFPRNHLTTTLLAVMPTISMPTPNIAKPSVAYSTCDLSENTCHEPMLSDVTAPPKSVETAQYLSGRRPSRRSSCVNILPFDSFELIIRHRTHRPRPSRGALDPSLLRSYRVRPGGWP